MAKKNKKVFKSNLKLEALEQRQLLAGIVGGSGTELVSQTGNGNDKFYVAPGSNNHYDQVLLNGPSVSVQNDPGTITRVSFLDLQGDIVQAEFSGAGTLTVSLDTSVAGYKTGVISPTGYNQTLTGAASAGYTQGLASFTISGSNETTNFNVFSVGSLTASAGNTLFDTNHKGGNNVADIQKIVVIADPANPLGSTMGRITAGNAIFSADSGVVGISAANVQVQDVVTVGDITTSATSTATPTLIFGANSQFGSVSVAGGGLVEANGKSINNAGSYPFGLAFTGNVKSDGTAIAAQTAPAGLSFTGNNPIAAQIKNVTLTTGVDTIVGTVGSDVITGQTGGVGATLTSLDSIDGGAGADSLTINDLDVLGTGIPAGVTIKNVETINLSSAGIAKIDTSTTALTGLTTLNVLTSTGADNIIAGAGQAVTVFDTAGKVTLSGGATQTVTTAGGVALDKATGAITVTDIAQGAAVTTINDGTTVTLTNTGTISGGGTTGTITVGGVTKPSGAVAITQNLAGDATYAAAVTGGAINVTGGTTVTVTEKATPTVNPTVGASNKAVNESAVTVNGAAGITTAVTITQSPAITSKNTAVAVAATTEVDVVTFSALTAGQSVKVDGLTVTAPTGGLTAAQVAAAFANLNSGALSGWTTGAVSGAGNNIVTFTATGTGSKTLALGGTTIVDTIQFAALAAKGTGTAKTVTILGVTYDDEVQTAGAGSTAAQVAAFFASKAFTPGNGVAWSSGAVTGGGSDTVVFTPTAAGVSDVKITASGSGSVTSITETPATVVSLSATTVGASKTDAAGRGSVTTGAVTVLDPNFGTASTNTIATVSLSNYSGATISSNALTSLTLTNTGAKDDGTDNGAVTINNTVATTLDLTISQSNNKGIGTITNNTYTTLKTHLTGSDTSLTFNDTAATALTVDGTKKLSLTGTGLTNLATITISGSAGFSSSTLAATVTDVNASGTSGGVSVTINPTTTTFEGGSGGDNVTVALVPTKAISGGAGTDTLTVTSTAITNPSIVSFISGFETLATGTGAAGASIDVTGFTSLSNSQTGVTFSNAAAGTALSVGGGSTTYTLKDATGAADTQKIDIKGTATVNILGLESVTIAAGDADNVLTLVDAAVGPAVPTVTSITINNTKDGKPLVLTATGNTALTTVDASAMSGGLTYTTEGTLAETVTGGSGGDSLTAKAGGKNDKLIGGGGNDTLTANNGQVTLTGGTGSDTFVIATPGTSLNSFSTVTDAAVGDVIRLADKGALETFAAVKLPLDSGTAVFQDFANAAVNLGVKDASVNGKISWFTFTNNKGETDTYIVESMHNADTGTGGVAGFVDGVDLVVKLSGIVDLSNAAFVQNGSSPEIVIR